MIIIVLFYKYDSVIIQPEVVISDGSDGELPQGPLSNSYIHVPPEVSTENTYAIMV